MIFALRGRLKRHRDLFFLGFVAFSMDSVLLYVGSSIHFLDGKLYSSPSQICATLRGQGIAGRHSYARLECFDLFFIAVDTMLFIRLTRLLTASDSTKLRRCLLAFVTLMAAFDVLETTGILVLMGQFPTCESWIAKTVSASTPAKWIALSCTLLGFSISTRPPRSSGRFNE